MKISTYKAIACVVWLVASTCCSFTAPTTSNDGANRNLDQLQDATSLGVIWQKYWAEGETPQEIRRQASATVPMTGWAARNDGSMIVYIDELRWSVHLDRDERGRWTPVWVETDGRLYEHNKAVSRLRMRSQFKSVAPLPEEAIQEEMKSQNADGVNRLDIWLTKEEVESVCSPRISSGEQQVYERMILEVTNDPAVRESCKLKGEERLTRKIWLGVASPDIPVLYYYIDGVPYLGIVRYKYPGYTVIRSEFQYIHDTPRQPEFEHVINSLRERGIQLQLGEKAVKNERP